METVFAIAFVGLFAAVMLIQIWLLSLACLYRKDPTKGLRWISFSLWMDDRIEATLTDDKKLVFRRLARLRLRLFAALALVTLSMMAIAMWKSSF